MQFFKSIIGTFTHRRAPRPDALESSALGKLPPELIIYVARFLQPDSASLFSLCCRPIYFTLGRKCFTALGKESDPDRYWFLTLLEQDLPNHILCYYCKKLHSIHNAQRHVPSAYRGIVPYMACWKANSDLMVDLHLHGNFSFTVFQMTMKLYRQGFDCTELLKLLSYKTKTYSRTHYSQYHYVEQSQALARIVNGCLLFREQRIFKIPSTQPAHIPTDSVVILCPHHNEYTFLRIGGDPIAIPDWGHEGEIMQCEYCFTEFRIELMEHGELGNTVFITKWQDLGQGQSPLDHKWQSHTTGHKGKIWVPVEFHRGSICAAFEQEKHPFRFEHDGFLTLQDKKEI